MNKLKESCWSMSEFLIPVNDSIKDFHKHLEAYPRTILSSKFGDGKSFFIQKIKEDPELTEQYEFLTIYPVNYQVAANRDIFELIKRDVLFQLLLHDMVSDRIVLTKQEMLSLYLNQKGNNVILDLITTISEIGILPEDSCNLIMAFKTVKLFKKLRDQYKSYRKNEGKDDDDRIDSFLDKADSHFIYEYDLITKIIQKAIEDFRRRTNKKVVLFVEDLDRIDPAHIFRILNVLSAHMDYGYRNFVKQDFSLVGNKFCLDNIVLVVDFNNLRSIYKHFYGQKTDFGGYISKFLSGTPFFYSLETLKCNYILDEISKITDTPKEVIEFVIPRDILISKTLRETVASFEIKKSIFGKPQIYFINKAIKLNTSILKLIAILKRMKWTNEEVVDRIVAISDFDFNFFVKFVLPYMFLIKDPLSTIQRNIIIKDHDRKYNLLIKLDVNSGCAYIDNQSWTSKDFETSEYSEVVNLMLQYVV